MPSPLTPTWRAYRNSASPNVAGMIAAGAAWTVDTSVTPNLLKSPAGGNYQIDSVSVANTAPEGRSFFNQRIVLHIPASASNTHDFHNIVKQVGSAYYGLYLGFGGQIQFYFSSSAGNGSGGVAGVTWTRTAGVAQTVTIDFVGIGAEKAIKVGITRDDTGAQTFSNTYAVGTVGGTELDGPGYIRFLPGPTGDNWADDIKLFQGDFSYYVRPEADDSNTSLTLSLINAPIALTSATVPIEIYGMPVGTYLSNTTAGGTLIATVNASQFPYKLTGLTADSYRCYVLKALPPGGTAQYSIYATQAKVKPNPIIAEPGTGIYGLISGPPIQLAKIGHSLIVGYDAATLAAQLAANGRTVNVSLHGVSGAKIADLAPGTSYYNSIKTGINTVMATRPSGTKLHLAIRIKVNDAFGGTSAADYATAMQTFLNALRADFPSAVLHILGDPFNWSATPPATTIQTSKVTNDLMDAYAAQMGQFAVPKQVYVRGTGARNHTSQHYEGTEDGTHFNATGNLLMSRFDASEYKVAIEDSEIPLQTGITLTYTVQDDGTVLFSAAPVPTNAATPTYTFVKKSGPGTFDAGTAILTPPAPLTTGTQSTVIEVSGGGYTAQSTYTTLVKLLAPTIAPAAGTVSTGQNVTVVDGGSGATNRYTVDGSTPIVTSPAYTATIPLTAPGPGLTNTTVKVRGFLAGYAPSDVVTAAYAVKPTAPVLTQQPNNRTVVAGGNVSVSAAADNSQSVQQQRLVSGTWTDIVGATSATFTRSGLVVGDSGQYRFAFINAGGTTYSNAFTLTVTAAPEPPAFVVQPVSQLLAIGDTLVLDAQVAGTETISYQIKKNGAVIDSPASLPWTKANLQAADSGAYTITATNVVTSTTSNVATISVTLEGNPSVTAISIKAEKTTIAPGETIHLWARTQRSGRSQNLPASGWGVVAGPGDNPVSLTGDQSNEAQWTAPRVMTATTVMLEVASAVVGFEYVRGTLEVQVVPPTIVAPAVLPPALPMGRGYVTETIRLTAGNGPIRLSYYAGVPLPDGVVATLHLKRGAASLSFVGTVVLGLEGLCVAVVDQVPESGDYTASWEVANVDYPGGFPMKVSVAANMGATA